MNELKPSGRRRVGRPGRHREDAEVSYLDAQLAALEEDIDTARAAAPHAVSGALHRSAGRGPERPLPHGEPIRLSDGRQILVRPVEPKDLALLREGFAHLSAVSRFRRFLGPVDHLSEDELRFFTQVDHARHEAFAALDAATGQGIGSARYIREEADPAVADVAVTVLDDWQHQGVGEALMDHLTAAARAAGVTHFSGRMIVGNHAAEQLLERAGDTVERVRAPGTLQLTVRLHG